MLLCFVTSCLVLGGCSALHEVNPPPKNIVLPNLVDYISTARLSSINFNNVHGHNGHNDISVRMIKLCGQSIVKPLSIIFKNCTDNDIFADIWKKCNIIPVHKKGDKQIIDNIDL